MAAVSNVAASAVFMLAALRLAADAHMVQDEAWPINPELGVSGFPDCVRLHPDRNLSMVDASFDLSCPQKEAAPSTIRIGCIGDSITAGVHSSGGNHTYPNQLQMMLDAKHGWGAYSVTNLGACGSTMLKGGDSPYWKRPQFQSLIAGKWDIITIMLGTNDAKDPGSHGPNNWHHNCGGPDHTTLDGCTFAQDFLSMISTVKKLGTTPAGPKIYVLAPPPLMAQGAYGMNQTVINSVEQNLAPLIAKAGGVEGVIDIYTGMGGVPAWQPVIPKGGCTLQSSFAPCKWWCDQQSCDECHPNDNGYHQLATVLYDGLGTPPSPPSPPAPPSPPGAWLYERGGPGKLWFPVSNFSANHNSGRKGALGWDACPRPYPVFDNGHPIWGAKGNNIEAVSVTGSVAMRGAGGCDRSFNYAANTTNVSPPFSVKDGIQYDGFSYLEIVS